MLQMRQSMPNNIPSLRKYQVHPIDLSQMWVDCYPSEDTNEGETMKCSGCNAVLDGKSRYYTLVCHNEGVFYPIPYCNPLCLAMDWNFLEAEV